MKLRSLAILTLSVLAMSGCSHTPVYTQAYYVKHKKARDKAINYCQKHKEVSRTREADCQAAANAAWQIYDNGKKPAKTVTYGNPNFGWLN
ncbi:EexN family lipoprotein [Acidithiobacillus sp. YTS05]|nr:EexN family lipoprotein [Acidithiobacillus sp. YTS05]